MQVTSSYWFQNNNNKPNQKISTMKTHIKILVALVLLSNLSHQSQAQSQINNTLDLGTIPAYTLEVTYDKTTHLIFPTAIRYVDLGSDYLIASKAEDAENVLRIKAAVRDFEIETNFSVITNDGRFYNFDVQYAPCPNPLSYDLLSMRKKANKSLANSVLFEELANTSPDLANLLLETIHQNNKRIIKHIGTKHFGLQFLLKGLYLHQDKYYFHLEFNNKTNLPFTIDFIHFKIVDKKIAKRTVIQERSLVPLRSYLPWEKISEKTVQQNVYLLNSFSLNKDQELQIELYEKNGSRHQTFKLDHSTLMQARLIDTMHLKF